VNFEQDLVAFLPRLRAYARSLVRNPHDADDLVQDVVVRALGARDRFEQGTNMRAWLFTILRNRFYNRFAANGRTFIALEDAPASALVTQPAHEWAIAQSELKVALDRLHPLQREALVLSVGAELSYAEIGQIIGCPVGTVKSRVFRARQELAALLHHGGPAPDGSALDQPSHPGTNGAGPGLAGPGLAGPGLAEAAPIGRATCAGKAVVKPAFVKPPVPGV